MHAFQGYQCVDSLQDLQYHATFKTINFHMCSFLKLPEKVSALHISSLTLQRRAL